VKRGHFTGFIKITLYYVITLAIE